MKQNYWIFLFLLILSSNLFAQPLNKKKAFTKTDSLRGSNTEHRSWWDSKKYTIDLTPNFVDKSLKGKVLIKGNVLQKPLADLQIDLAEEMIITRAKLNFSGKTDTLKYQRKGRFYFFDKEKFTDLEVGDNFEIALNFEGNPAHAKLPPWNGGWVFENDSNGNPWASAAVQGKGASHWFPAKDFWGDEPEEGMEMNLFVPEGLTAVGNGKLVKTHTNNGLAHYQWKVVNPINLYNIIPNIADYAYFQDKYYGINGELSLDYYVLKENLQKAKKQFQQVKPMLSCFEDWFGPYPFYEDGYKLVETPYLGMEHQSNIAYGNAYGNGYKGRDLSGSGWGLKWDFIIIHESGHEWFGNSITASDPADMWFHEAFTMYSEVIFTQCTSGLQAGNEYAQGLQNNILNDRPIQGYHGVWQEGSSDMYAKGATMVHTLRQLVENEWLFKQALRDLNKTFYHQTVNSQQVENFLSDYFNKDLTAFFNQYVRETNLPVLEYYLKGNQLNFRYVDVVEGFDMPLKLNGLETQWIFPTQQWKSVELKSQLNSINKPIDPNFLVLKRKVKN